MNKLKPKNNRKPGVSVEQLLARIETLEKESSAQAEAYARLRSVVFDVSQNVDIRQAVLLRVCMDIIRGTVRADRTAINELDYNSYLLECTWVTLLIEAVLWMRSWPQRLVVEPPPEEQPIIFGGT